MAKLFPCFGCENRKIGCHGKCPDYKKAAAENERRKNSRAISSAYIEREPISKMRKRAKNRRTGMNGGK